MCLACATVTKGSFYHRFRGMAGYRTAPLEHDESERTRRHIAQQLVPPLPAAELPDVYALAELPDVYALALRPALHRKAEHPGVPWPAGRPGVLTSAACRDEREERR